MMTDLIERIKITDLQEEDKATILKVSIQAHTLLPAPGGQGEEQAERQVSLPKRRGVQEEDDREATRVSQEGQSGMRTSSTGQEEAVRDRGGATERGESEDAGEIPEADAGRAEAEEGQETLNHGGEDQEDHRGAL